MDSSSKSRQSQTPSASNRVMVRPTVPPIHRYEWQIWPDVAFKVTNIPPEYLDTRNIYKEFSKHGTIVRVEIFENRFGMKEDGARIRFDPPPHHAFWHGNGQYQLPGINGRAGSVVKIAVEPRKRGTHIQSPLRPTKFYPEKMKMEALKLEFGVLFQENSMMTMSSALTSQPEQVGLTVDMVRKQLTGSFCYFISNGQQLQDQNNLESLDRYCQYTFQISFEHLSKIQRVAIDENNWSLIISLTSPPPFFRKRVDADNSHTADSLIWTEFDSWFRQTEVTYDPAHLLTKSIKLHDEFAILDIGRWTTYRFVFDKKNKEISDLFSLAEQALSDFNIEVVSLEHFQVVASESPLRWKILSDRTRLLPFDVLYQLEVCISRGILREQNLTVEFLDSLTKLAKKDSNKAREVLEFAAEKDVQIFNPEVLLQDLDAQSTPAKAKIPDYCAWMRKANITPTTVYYSTPTVETSNRVIRQFSQYGDRFLRVQFTDELSEGRINSCADKRRNDAIFIRVFRTLRSGITVGDRHYEFLAFGNSQFRENGAWFFCPLPELSCDDIRNWMGDFRHIRSPAKYAARLGQCFSTTRAVKNAVNVEIVEIQDIERNGYCFTDGVGKISEGLLRSIAIELGHSLKHSFPCAIQFRLGGCKGILVASPDVQGHEVHIRKSQAKFKAVYNGLEIIRPSRFSPATLNRQTITILSALGVEDITFHDLLTKQLSNYQKAMSDKTEALSLLGRYIDENHMTLQLSNIILDGFMESSEPFVMSLLHLWRTWSFKLLKEKAKIIVEDGAFLIGCVDETSTLKGHLNSSVTAGTTVDLEDLPEVFVQIPDKDHPGCYVVIEGLCVLGRNPSLHPGDLRIVRAVDNPLLHHLRDVVVMPSRGDRDIPSMCSGGDLDGDDYFIIWDSGLIPRRWNVDPMDYAAPPATILNKHVSVKDLMVFFVQYMKNDTLPTIAHAHLAQSDYLDRGVNDPKCVRLAQLHSQAVDYVKTGLAAEMPRNLRPRKWPHFMEKKYKPKDATYVSRKILGQLYDKVDRVDFQPQYKLPFDTRILRAYQLETPILKSARQLKSQYDAAMKRTMAHEGINTEFEVWSTFVLSRRRVGSDYKMQEVMEHISSALKDRFRALVIEKAGGKEFARLGPFVAAMYRVTWEEMQIALHECSNTKTVGGREVPLRKMESKFMPLMSYPWLFPEILGRIATGRKHDLHMDELTLRSPKHAPAKQQPSELVDASLGASSTVKTATGITRRGELLNIFDSDDEEDNAVVDTVSYRHGLIELISPNVDDESVSEVELDAYSQLEKLLLE